MRARREPLSGLAVALIALQKSAAANISGYTTPGVTSTNPPAPIATVCPARTINYITHALPQSCLTSSWTNPIPKAIESEHAPSLDATMSDVSHADAQEPQQTNATPQDNSEAVSIDALPTTFMSFEDWKEMMLRRTGQDPQDLRSRKSSERGAEHRVPPDSGHAGLGEEDEIYLNFDTFLREDDKGSVGSGISSDAMQQKDSNDDPPPGYRSKDAGKTCKERFSYSSFDAGATILKSSPGAKNAKAILAENKDSYMLLECAAETKYVIVELSDDILVDTVVLANFEFFSSMIRHFRVSVSDRYPVKGDKWQELGVFEARNSRDIQPFLVENPWIWAKYIRIDFLTHFGNEYYCPVSLLRVHGSRMLDSWKEVAHQEEEVAHLIEEPPPDARTEALPATAGSMEPQPVVHESVIKESDSTALTCGHPESVFFLSTTCQAPVAYYEQPYVSPLSLRQKHGEALNGRNTPTEAGNVRSPPTPATVSKVDNSTPVDQSMASSSITPAATHSSMDNRISQQNNGTNATVNNAGDAGTDPSSSGNRAPGAAGSSKSRNNAASGAASTATVQEGFFNAITKRLQQVESNLTLSLKYVEDQSRYMQEALHRGEQKQLSKVTLFLETLNQTVLADLRHLRDQYDQIWQSTVIALESHREQSERDVLALGSRLNLLADEVVFQKRMAIVQAVLLLSCLFLVIFSRGVPIPYFAPVLDQNTASASYRPRVSLSAHSPDGFQTDVAMPQASVDISRPHIGESKPLSIADGDGGHSHGTESRLEEQTTIHAADDNLREAHYRPISPSPTPEPHAEAADDSEFRAIRHGHLMSSRQSSARKPLPALPEQGESP